jgi:ribosomal 30S subunit maturation factor RimM
MRLLVGRIGRAHGILGEATIEVRTDKPKIALPLAHACKAMAMTIWS